MEKAEDNFIIQWLKVPSNKEQIHYNLCFTLLLALKLPIKCAMHENVMNSCGNLGFTGLNTLYALHW